MNKHQVICNVYDDHKELQDGIQYFLNLYGTEAKIVVKVAPITNFRQVGDLIQSGTQFLLTVLIFAKYNFNGDQS